MGHAYTLIFSTGDDYAVQAARKSYADVYSLKEVGLDQVKYS